MFRGWTVGSPAHLDNSAAFPKRGRVGTRLLRQPGTVLHRPPAGQQTPWSTSVFQQQAGTSRSSRTERGPQDASPGLFHQEPVLVPVTTPHFNATQFSRADRGNQALQGEGPSSQPPGGGGSPANRGCCSPLCIHLEALLNLMRVQAGSRSSEVSREALQPAYSRCFIHSGC